MINLKNISYEDKKIRDIMKKSYQIKKNLINQRNFINFPKMVLDTMLNFSTYTNILTSYPTVYHTLM